MTQATEHWTGKLAREEEEKRIRKDEREKVLRDLQNIIAQHCGEGIHKGWLLAYPIDRWIADKLRQKEGGCIKDCDDCPDTYTCSESYK